MVMISQLADKIIEEYERYASKNLLTVAISGIDGSGKSYITDLLQKELEERKYNTANINIDPWQNPISVRLRKENAAVNVYENIFRWDAFFQQLIFPLQKNKGIYLETEGIRSDSDVYYRLVYDYNDLDILLIEGILLFKKEYRLYYDYKIWIDCSFEAGLKRAIKRNVEKLPADKLIDDYNSFYYAAQRYHFNKDKPTEISDILFCNDESLGTVGQMTNPAGIRI